MALHGMAYGGGKLGTCGASSSRLLLFWPRANLITIVADCIAFSCIIQITGYSNSEVTNGRFAE